MPAWDAVERHSIRIRVPADAVWRVARAMDFRGSMLIRTLFALRSLPALLTRGSAGGEALGCDMDGLLRSGFVLLEEREGAEMVLGLVGRFWTAAGGIQRVTPDEFRAWDRPGFARAAWNLSLAPSVNARETTLSTETRVLCTDTESRRSFLRYWRLVGPFSALIRLEMLRAIRREAERG
jgi:hypothetical protein